MKKLDVFNIAFLMAYIIFCIYVFCIYIFGCSFTRNNTMTIHCKYGFIEPLIIKLFLPLLIVAILSSILGRIVAHIAYNRDYNEMKLNGLDPRLLNKKISFRISSIYNLLDIVHVFIGFFYFMYLKIIELI